MNTHDAVRYERIAEGEPLPDLSAYAPFRAVIILATRYSNRWQRDVSRWLVDSGCLYMMAWGPDCSSWDDSVDRVNIDDFPGDIPADRFVMTTWHAKVPLDEVFWFATFCACHPDVELKSTLLLHVSHRNEGDAMLSRFAAVEEAS